MPRRSRKPAPLVTRDSLQKMLNDADFDGQVRIVGRALVVLFKLQTADEKRANTTENTNTVGFSSSDARTGCLGAKYYLAHNTMESWQLHQWTRKMANGYARICKYARQLNEAALAKAERRAHQQGAPLTLD